MTDHHLITIDRRHFIRAIDNIDTAQALLDAALEIIEKFERIAENERGAKAAGTVVNTAQEMLADVRKALDEVRDATMPAQTEGKPRQAH